MQKNNGNGMLSTKRVFRTLSAAAAAAAVAVTTIAGVFMALPADVLAAGRDEAEVVLRVCNWEEYIDLGDWDEEETIEWSIPLSEPMRTFTTCLPWAMSSILSAPRNT